MYWMPLVFHTCSRCVPKHSGYIYIYIHIYTYTYIMEKAMAPHSRTLA